MGAVDAIKTCFTKYATFSGRASRPEYWWFLLFILLGAAVTGLLDRGLFPAAAIPPLTGIFQLGTLLPLLAVGWRRMQDTGRPGSLIFLPLTVSVAFIFLSVMGFASGPNPNFNADAGGSRFVILGLLQFVAFVFIVWWLTRPSETGTNVYGSNPTEVPQ